MKAMVLQKPREQLVLEDIPQPQPDPDEVLIQVKACGVCRTDLHIFDGELPDPKLPVILGHEIVGTVVSAGQKIKNLKPGDLIGVPWLGGICQACSFCTEGKENLCDKPVFTGYLKNGGYAEYVCANANYCFPLPKDIDPISAAPLLCAGLIGWRCLKFTGRAKHLGIYGFGGAAHIIAQVAVKQGRQVYAFTRPEDNAGQEFARSLRVTWAGGSDQAPPVMLDAAIIFAPAGELVLQALKVLNKGGTIVLGGIHMSDIPDIPYRLLWGERVIRSIANLTRQDATEFLPLIDQIKTTVTPYPLDKANEALSDLRAGRVHAAAVLVI